MLGIGLGVADKSDCVQDDAVVRKDDEAERREGIWNCTEVMGDDVERGVAWMSFG